MTIDRYKHLGRSNITFLRNPIERIVSEYSTLLRRRKKIKYKNIIEYSESNNRVNIMQKMTGGNLNKFDFVG